MAALRTHRDDHWLPTPTVGWLDAPPAAKPRTRFVAARLPLLLAAFDMSQLELARRSGVSRQTVHVAYSGQTVSLEMLIRLARAIGVPLSALSVDAARMVAEV